MLVALPKQSIFQSKLGFYSFLSSDYLFISVVFILFISIKENLRAEQHCFDYNLFSNGETIQTFAMDTTDNWWAVTKPFEDRYRMIINDYVSESYVNVSAPTFSPNGDSWAFWGQNISDISLETNDTLIQLGNYSFGNITYSGNSQVLAYWYQVNALTQIVVGKNRISDLQNFNSNLVLNFEGDKFAYSTQNGSTNDLYIFSNGFTQKIGTFEDIRIVGFWSDNSIYYFAKNGDYWSLYNNKKVVIENLVDIPEFKLNLQGTFIAFIGKEINGNFSVYSYNDELAEFQITRPYRNISELKIHPFSPLYSFKANNSTNDLIVMSFSEYNITAQSSELQFTFDGEQIYYLFCDNSCFLGVNGLNYQLKSKFDAETKITKQPNSKTFAYSTNSNLVVYNLETGEMSSGMMVDQILPPRYNRFEKRYETIGKINNSLYLLTCHF